MKALFHVVLSIIIAVFYCVSFKFHKVAKFIFRYTTKICVLYVGLSYTYEKETIYYLHQILKYQGEKGRNIDSFSF